MTICITVIVKSFEMLPWMKGLVMFTELLLPTHPWLVELFFLCLGVRLGACISVACVERFTFVLRKHIWVIAVLNTEQSLFEACHLRGDPL